MSHVVTVSGIELQDDEEFLRRIAERVGGKLLRQDTYRWAGTWVDDSPVPRNLFETEEEYQRVVGMSRPARKVYMKNLLGKCEWAITFPGCECDVGVVRVGGRLELVWDWASSLMNVLGRPDVEGYVNPFVQAAAWASATLAAERNGFSWSEAGVNEKGEILLDINV